MSMTSGSESLSSRPHSLLFPLASTIASPQEAWEQIKTQLQQSVEKADFETWLQPLKANVISDNTALILVPNRVYYQTIHDRFLNLIDQMKVSLSLDHFFFLFELESNAADDVALDSAAAQREICASQPPPLSGPMTPSVVVSRSLSSESFLNPNYTFDTFVKGASNQFAMTTCQAVANKPGQSYNPLFIYGSTGLGKTHLLHAVGNQVLKSNPNAVVTYITSERFMNELVYCIRFQKMWEFRQKYRMCDVILIDDIQFISGKKATQEEFFHTFNTLHAAKKQIVITSDLFPQEIPEIEDRLRNRFQWGLIADIQVPDLEHRIAILQKKAQQLRIPLTMDVAEYIARHTRRNVRELEGHLARLQAFSQFHGEPISMELAIKTFRDIIAEPPRRLTVETVQKIVADHFKIKVTDLKSRRKHSEIAFPRQIAMYLARKLTSASFPELGQKFGGKDHTTVLHNVKKIDNTLATDLDLKSVVETLERQIEQSS